MNIPAQQKGRRPGLSLFILLAMLICGMNPSPLLTANNRDIPEQPAVTEFTIGFNGDSLRGFCLVLDFRTGDEKASDLENRKTAGDVIVFIHGHSQRADDGYPLTSKLAAMSKSGIVIIPVCDTPFGKESSWRGDRGKEVILMEMVRHQLAQMNIAVKNHIAITDMPVSINGQAVKNPAQDSIQAELAMAGWSHGALLSRRLAHAYPGCVTSLVQMAPAGFAYWGGEYCTGPACLTTSFGCESACIGLGVFRGEFAHITDAGCGMAKGLFGDTGRSCSSCISGNFSVFKLFRSYRDVSDCSLYADDTFFPLPGIKNITVIFAAGDTLFEYDDHGGIKDPAEVTPGEGERFFEKYYPSSVKGGAKCTLAVLPGSHIGPIVHSERFAETALSSIGQRR
ncbi:MAG: hypothetical protein GXY14_13815 [Spirochaetes bacterium]|nr:hypothetical protein [Spirochaetota bacterium]